MPVQLKGGTGPDAGYVLLSGGLVALDASCCCSHTGICCTGVNCTSESEGDCRKHGTWKENENSCTPNPCAPPSGSGACCIGASCTIKTRDDCAAAAGAYYGDDSTCAGVICTTAPPTVNCSLCYPSVFQYNGHYFLTADSQIIQTCNGHYAPEGYGTLYSWDENCYLTRHAHIDPTTCFITDTGWRGSSSAHCSSTYSGGPNCSAYSTTGCADCACGGTGVLTYCSCGNLPPTFPCGSHTSNEYTFDNGYVFSTYCNVNIDYPHGCSYARTSTYYISQIYSDECCVGGGCS
jgi:hypothetical protein